jgi:methylenetetrahydrofolate dehydrogenase (NADP+)/methenyltetrahydrofolate cyclohydrolase
MMSGATTAPAEGARLIDGAAVAKRVREQVAADVAALRERGVVPGLTVVLVGDDPASAVYVGGKEKASREAGMAGDTNRLPASTPQAELLDLVERLNADARVHGILVQMPLPRHIDPEVVINHIRPDKDVDGFHPVNVGKLLIGHTDGFVPCTPAGVQLLLGEYGVRTAGAECVIVGRSTIVGKPMAALMMQSGPLADATVTVCHSRTRDLAAHTREADILVVAAGRARLVTGAMVIGPTPRGTGVMSDATGRTLSKSTSPTSRVPLLAAGSAMRFIPTSITTAPGLTIAPVTSRARPAATTRMSASRVCAARSRVRL